MDRRHFYSFGEEILQAVQVGIATRFDGQIFVLAGRPTSVFNNDQIAHLFTKDGHQKDEFRINSEDNVYCCLACYLRGKQIVFGGSEWNLKEKRMKVGIYRKDGVFNRSVTHDKNFVRILFITLQSSMMLRRYFFFFFCFVELTIVDLLFLL